jgi:hypothetical protein
MSIDRQREAIRKQARAYYETTGRTSPPRYIEAARRGMWTTAIIELMAIESKGVS